MTVTPNARFLTQRRHPFSCKILNRRNFLVSMRLFLILPDSWTEAYPAQSLLPPLYLPMFVHLRCTSSEANISQYSRCGLKAKPHVIELSSLLRYSSPLSRKVSPECYLSAVSVKESTCFFEHRYFLCLLYLRLSFPRWRLCRWSDIPCPQREMWGVSMLGKVLLPHGLCRCKDIQGF